MRRILGIGASLALALLVVTCVDKTITGPQRFGVARFSFAALTPIPGNAPVPVDSLEIILKRADSSVALDTVLPFRTDTASTDSGVVRINVLLRQSPEDFSLSVRAFGGGTNWYTATGSVTVTAGGAGVPALLAAKYVGPGANAARVTIAPVDTTAVGGVGFALRATVYDSSSKVIAGVPVGFRISDTTRASVTNPTPYAGRLTGKTTVRDSAWVYAQTPTHLKDSTWVHIVPPAASLSKIAGDAQSSIVNSPLPVPLKVRVLDALGGGFTGDTVRWTLTAGNATLAAAFSVSDTGGYAVMSVTPMAIGALTVQAAVAGLTGSPVTFTETAIAGTIKSVTISPKLDTIQNATTLQYTAVAKDSIGNTVNTTFGWTSTVTTVATVNSSGLAAAVGGDSTKVIALAGGIADTARLYVRALRTITVSPADTVITAVGDSVLLKASPVDNFGAAVTTGVNIRWLSASPTIATVNRTTGRAKLTGPGNAVILATDSVLTSDSLVRGNATLRVNQVTDSVRNTPRDTVRIPPASGGKNLLIGVGGQSQVVATALDRNGYPIPGKTFGYASRNTAVVSVNASGVVTGLSLGYAFVVDSVDGFKDSTLVGVVTNPPAQILWTFDSTAVGNGGNIGVGITVTVPPAVGTTLTINITSSDSTVAKANPNSVTIGAGASGTTATLYGVHTGCAVLTAKDGSGLGYQQKSMTLCVVSTLNFREPTSPGSQQQYFYVNQNETHHAQVWLSDPAPAGGLGVTFTYKAGNAVVTPSPAVIPAGQLSADVLIRGLTPNTSNEVPDSVTPTSGGYVGQFSYVYVAPDSLRLYEPYSYNTVGAGQTVQPEVYFTYSMDHPLTISTRLTHGLGQTPDTVIVATNSDYRYFTVTAGNTPGTDTLTVSATGWTAASTPLIVTTPKLQIEGNTSLVAGAPDGYWFAYTEDSLGYSHAVADTVYLTVAAHIPSTSVNPAIAVDTASATVLPGSSNTTTHYTLRPLAGAGGDSAWVVVSAPGYRSDSMKVYVTKPTLSYYLGYPYATAIGTLYQNAGQVQIPYARTDTFTMRLHHTQRSIVGGPDYVSIPKGQIYGYFNLSGLALGTDTITVDSAPGYVLPAYGVFQVLPMHVIPYSYSTSLYTISAPQPVNVLERDSVYGYARPLIAPLTVNLAVNNAQAFTLDFPTVTIPAGAVTSGYDTLRVAATPTPGTAKLFTSVTGYTGGAPGSTPDSSSAITLSPTPLTLYLASPSEAGWQLQLQNNYVSLPAVAPSPVTVTLTSRNAAQDTLSTHTLTIAKGSSTSSTFTIVAIDSSGRDSITADAPGFVEGYQIFNSVPAGLSAGNPGTSHLTTEAPQQAVLYLRMRSPAYTQNAVKAITVGIKSTNKSILRIDTIAGFGVPIDSDSVNAVVPAGSYYAYYKIRYVGISGNPLPYIRISAPGFSADSTPGITVTGPSLYLSATTLTVGQGNIYPAQYVYVSNPVTSPLTVTLSRSDSTASPANQVFTLDSTTVTIPTGSYYSSVFQVSGNNDGGNSASSQLIARAPGYAQATGTVTVGQPRLVAAYKNITLYVGQPVYPLYVYSADQNGSTYQIVRDTIVVGDTSSAPAIATTDSAFRKIPARTNYTLFNPILKQVGSAAIVYSSPGYRPDTTQISVQTAALTVAPASGVVVTANGGTYSSMYVEIPFSTVTPITVNLSSSNTSVLSVPATVTIPANSYYQYFTVTGGAAGTAMVSATATGFAASTPAIVTVQ